MKKNKLIVFVGVGVEAVAIIMAAVWSGQWLDSHFQLKNLFTIILPLLGLAGWIYHILIMVKNLM